MSFAIRQFESLYNNSSASNTSNIHISRTTTRTPKMSSAMCSTGSCGHVDICSVEKTTHSGCYSPEVELDVYRWNQRVYVHQYNKIGEMYGTYSGAFRQVRDRFAEGKKETADVHKEKKKKKKKSARSSNTKKKRKTNS